MMVLDAEEFHHERFRVLNSELLQKIEELHQAVMLGGTLCKLGVRNRTEAVARYLRRRRMS
jgi:hypothetical protein